MELKKQIWFHVGLGKTASTWLQNKVFTQFTGVYYIHPTRYRKYRQIIDSTEHAKYFVSREMDQQLEREVKKFAEKYPDTQPIIVLRRNEAWIASQYRRFLKNGYPYTFTEFFDVEKDSGFWKIADALFFPKIEILCTYFTQKPLILFYEDMRKDPFACIDKIAAVMGAQYQRENISLEPHHISYAEKQLKAMLRIAPFLFTKAPAYKGSRFNTWIRRRSRMLACYLILFVARLLPASLFSKKPLIPPEELAKVKEYFAEDWARCKRYAEENQI